MPLSHAQPLTASLDSAASRAVLPASECRLRSGARRERYCASLRLYRALYDLATPVGMRFTQSGGNIGFPPLAELALPIVEHFYVGVGGPSFENDLLAYCLSHRVSAILVGPGTPAPLAAAVEALHWQEVQNHGIRVVHVPDRLRVQTKAERE